MTEADLSSSAVKPAKKKPNKTIRLALKGYKARQQLRFGCLPASALLVVVLLGLGAILTYQSVPSYILRPRSYLIEGQLTVALSILLASQLLINWFLGLFAAGSAKRVSQGGRESYPLRMRIIRRRMFFPTVSVLLVRTLFILVFGFGLVFAYTEVLGPPIRLDAAVLLRNSFRSEFLVMVVFSILLLVHWFVGPYLRMRYTTALSALAATYALEQEDRISFSLGARLSAGLLFNLLLLWGGAIALTLWLSLVDPSNYGVLIGRNPFASSPLYFPPTYSVAFALLIAQIALLVLVVHMAAQLILPLLFSSLTRYRLKKLSS